jgi:hypothetical protein
MREVLYNIRIDVGLTTKLVRLMKICLNGKYNKDLIRKYLPAVFLSKIV